MLIKHSLQTLISGIALKFRVYAGEVYSPMLRQCYEKFQAKVYIYMKMRPLPAVRQVELATL